MSVEQPETQPQRLWDRFKSKLKSVTRFSAKYVFPIAVSFIPGGELVKSVAERSYEYFKDQLEEKDVKADQKLIQQMFEQLKSQNASTNEILQNIQNEVLKLNNGKKAEDIQATLDAVIRPVLGDIQNIIQITGEEIRNNNLQGKELYQILEGWANEQLSTIDSMHHEINGKLDYTRESITEFLSKNANLVNNNLKSINNSMAQIDSKLTDLQRTLNQNLALLCGTRLGDLSHSGLLSFSEAFIQQSQISSRFDVPYNPDLFVPNPDLTKIYLDFIEKCLDPLTIMEQRIFLILANLGMGKTWNAVHLSLYSIREQKLPVFFISLEKDFARQLKIYFGTDDFDLIGKFCTNTNAKYRRPVLFILDGLDEVKIDTHFKGIFGFMEYMMKHYNNDVLFILTCRLVDWNAFTPILTEVPKITRYIYPCKSFKGNLGIICKTDVSMVLSTIDDDDQLDTMIRKYGLNPSLMDKELMEFCRMPFFIRLLSDYIQKNMNISSRITEIKYPNSKNMTEFFPLFTDEQDSYNTILGRMGIIGNIRKFFLVLLKKFPSLDSAINYDDVKDMIESNRPEWIRVLSSGLLQEKDEFYSTNISINPIYRKLVGHLIEKLKIGKNPQQSINVSKNLSPIQGSQTAQNNSALSPNVDKINAQNKVNTLVSEAQIAREFKNLDDVYTKLQDALSVANQFELDNTPITQLLVPITVELKKQKAEQEQLERERLEKERLEKEKLKQIEEEQKRKQIELQKAEEQYRGLKTQSEKHAENLDWTNAISCETQIADLSKKHGWADRMTQAQQNISKFTQLKEASVIVDYHGKKLIKYEYDVITEIEKKTGAIPFTWEIKYDTFGIKIENNHVTGLGLYEKGLTSLPEVITRMTWLQSLNIADIGLTSLPETIGNLTSLTYLNLGSNQLTSLPEIIGNLTSLQSLGLGNNKLTSLPETIGNLTSLQRLGLRNNKLTSLPVSIGNLTSLQTLNLRDNKLTSLPEWKLIALKKLVNQGCKVYR